MHDRRVHHYRLTLNGRDRDVARLAEELASAGAQPLERGEGMRLLWSTPSAPDALAAMSRRHRRVTLGVEWFESFEDRFAQLVVAAGTATVMDLRRAIEGAEWGQWHDEDGEPLDGALLRAAAERVAAEPVDCGPGCLATGLDSALLAGREMGRLAAAAEADLYGDAPPEEAVAAVARLGATALTICATTRSVSSAELEFERAWRLTKALVSASRDELCDRPGMASWPEWLRVVLGAASDVVDAACHCDALEPNELGMVAYEHLSSPSERLESAAGGLVASCLQALALFA